VRRSTSISGVDGSSVSSTKNPPLAQRIALPVDLREQLLLRPMDLLEDRAFGVEVARADSRGPLMDDVLEKMGRPVLAVRFLHGAEPIPESRRDARDPAVLDHQHPEAIVENGLADVERPVRLRHRACRWGRRACGMLNHRLRAACRRMSVEEWRSRDDHDRGCRRQDERARAGYSHHANA
jgi:hypothetical protein